MASTKLEKLMFLIGMKDEASGKAGKFAANMQRTVGNVQKHFKGLGIAGAGVYGAAKSIQALVGPAVELNRALSEAGSEGVGAAGLKLLQGEAGKLAVAYGLSANDVIKSSVGMQRAIKDLSDREIADFTGTANLLAKAGRMSVETTTGYMGTMYGIFEAQAGRMGKSQWAAHMAAQTDFISKTFKTRGDEIAAGFSALGNKAQKAGVSAGEQMAVLAALQKNMSGDEAGKKYASFLDNASRAQRALGISFKDSQGNMLPMAGILDKIKAKYGETLTEAQQKQFGKAFGDEDSGKFINTLLSQSGKLGQAVQDVSKITNMNGVRTSARANTDAYQRWSATVGFLRANFMQKLMPTLDKFTNKATDKLEVLNQWINKYPNVARVIGRVALVVTSLAGAVALGTAAYHLYKLSALALGGPFKLMSGLTKALIGGFTKLGAVMLANPIILVVVGIAAAIGLVIYYWKDLKAAFANSTWGAPFLWVMECLEEKWNMLTSLFTDFTWTKLLKLVIATALMPLEAFVNGIGSLLDKVGIAAGKDLKNWKASEFAEKLVGPEAAAPSGTAAVAAVPGMQVEPTVPAISSLAVVRETEIPRGGIIGAANKVTNTNNGKSINVGEQHIHFENPPENREEYLAMQFG